MQKIAKKLKAATERLKEAPFVWWLAFIAVITSFIYLFLEITVRGSLVDTVIHIFTRPLVFLINYAIIFITFTPTGFLKKRLPLTFVTSAVWIVLGISNAIVLSYRSNPLSAIDFLVVKSMMNMATVYFTVIQLILIAIAFAGAAVLVVFMTLKCPQFKVSYKGATVSVLATAGVIALLRIFFVSFSAADYGVGELDLAYRDYGFSYCFATSLFSQGVERPRDYDPSKTDDIVESLWSEDSESGGAFEEPTDADVLPNIIIVQLESFMDLSNINGIEIDEDPIPNFTRLKNEGVSGYLRVPHVGGGTANIEFEVLTGMNLDHFGFGEYPYTTVLKTGACESIAANMKTLGYGTHALHNHIAEFYDRDLAYAGLGFDTFTPVEMMCDVTRNSLGWANDMVLKDEILSALDLTSSPDVVFSVSVQGHGKYPEEPLDVSGGSFVEDSKVLSYAGADFRVHGIADETITHQFEYYASQIHEMDLFIGELLEALGERGEPYVAVFYGDHLPALPIDQAYLKNGDLYETEYAIASNIDLGGVAPDGDINLLDMDLEATHLLAYVQKLCGLSIGQITALHQRELETGEDYDGLLENLEYKQLYDTEDMEYHRTDMRFGTRALSVDSWASDGNTLRIKGSGFTEYTEVKIGGIRRDAIVVDSSTLLVENVFFDHTELEVQWLSSSGRILAAVTSAK